MSKIIKITTLETRQFLRNKYGSTVTDVQQLGRGGWSYAYKFVNGGIKSVIRWSDVVDNFERDAYALHFNRKGLPIPQISDIGRVNGKFYAISPFVVGSYLELLKSTQLEDTLPAILKMFRALRSVDLSKSTGYGFWNKNGDGSHRSWKEFLLDDKNESEASLIRGWRVKLESSSIGVDSYKYLRSNFESLVEKCPENRNLVHSDLLNRNVLVKSSNITAVLDWGSSFYGDSLYDVVWFMFYKPWYPNFKAINLTELLLEDFKADPYTNKENLDARLLCYKLDIGIGSIAYNAYKNNWKNAQEVAEYTLKITS